MKNQTMAPVLWITLLSFMMLLSCDRPANKTQISSAVPQKSVTDLKAEEEQDAPLAVEAEVAELIKLQDKMVATADLTTSGAMIELPEWLAKEDIPFDTEPYFEIDQDQNGGQNYLRAAAYADLSSVIMSLPNLNREVKDLTADQQRLVDLDNKLGKVRYRLLDHLYEPQNPDYAEYFKANVDSYLKRVEPIVAQLSNARKFRSSLIYRNFALDSYGPFSGFRNVAQDLSILQTTVSEIDKTVDTIRMTMELGRVLRQYGSKTEQLTAASILRFAIDDQVKPALNNASDPKHLDMIIEVLEDAHLSEREMPRFLEHAKYEHLQLRQLLHELQTDTLEYDAEAYDYFGIGDDAPTVLKAHKLLTTDFIGGYLSNEELAIDLLKETVSTEQLEQAKQLIEESRASPRSQDAAAGMIIPAIMASFNSMDADDFRKEIEILKVRYRYIEKCTELPFPDQIDAISILQTRWTNDQQWKKTRFLKWYRPHQSLGRISAKVRLMIDGYLSLACLKKFQLENGGRLPDNVFQALSAAGIEYPEDVIDPYSGKEFKIPNNQESRLVIYSVGPDRKDDRGEKVLSVDEYRPDDLGDVLLSLQ